MRRRSRRSPWIATLLLAASCHGSATAPEEPRAPASEPRARLAPPPLTTPAAAAPTAPPEPVVIIADPRVLASLEEKGFDAGTTITGVGARSAAELARHPAYATLRDFVARDLARDRASDPGAGVGMRFSHRQFDAAWLSSEKAHFDLISVVNRLDRRPFSGGRCGEIRFVYRLAYRPARAGGIASRLPMTVNVVHFVEPEPDGSCIAAARSFLRPSPRPADEAAWLVSEGGPLSPSRRARFTPKSVELDFQSVRWPSTVRPSLGGHAEYVLRVFRRLPGAPFFEPSPLENTLDVDRIRKSPALRDELVQWVRTPDALASIDRGTAIVPERFLASRAVSVAPHGLARRGNRPYRSVLSPGDLAGLDLSGTETVRSPAALLRRLDALSCPGCHQSRSIAGFHLLGVEGPEDREDAVEVPMSPHFHADLGRRAAYTEALAAGRDPDDRRPPAERGAGDDGPGAHCGLGDPGFSAWTCGAGLLCARGSDDEVGECRKKDGPSIGDACETGPVISASSARRDSARLAPPSSCGDGRVCEVSSVGFPGGMCSGGCTSLAPDATCGGIALLDEFNACLGAGTAFDRCLATATRPGALRSCSFHSPCRDDYVCARVPTGGACLPPYFLFQLRVDGHRI